MLKGYIKLSLQLFFFMSIITLSSCDKENDSTPKIVIEPSQVNIEVELYSSKTLKAILDDVTLAPEEVIWSSKDTSIVSVDQNGYIHAHWAGETEVVATLINGDVSASCRITAYDKHSYKLRLNLKDKGASNFSLDRPLEFLSRKAIERRVNQNLSIDESDLPISQDYIKDVEKIGGKLVAKSKWLKTITVHIDDVTLLDKYTQLSFVKNVEKVWQGSKASEKSAKTVEVYEAATGQVSAKSNIDSAYYGEAWDNIKMNKGHALHELNYKGDGIDIAEIGRAHV